jgi:hypothetical protein
MLKYREIEHVIIAEPGDNSIVISDVQEMLDLMGDAGAAGCNRLIIREQNLHPDFFRLHTGLAGEILQKFSTYDFMLAIIGDFAKYQSKSLQDFIRESNKGNRIFFLRSIEDAERKLNLR